MGASATAGRPALCGAVLDGVRWQCRVRSRASRRQRTCPSPSPHAGAHGASPETAATRHCASIQYCSKGGFGLIEFPSHSNPLAPFIGKHEGYPRYLSGASPFDSDGDGLELLPQLRGSGEYQPGPVLDITPSRARGPSHVGQHCRVVEPFGLPELLSSVPEPLRMI